MVGPFLFKLTSMKKLLSFISILTFLSANAGTKYLMPDGNNSIYMQRAQVAALNLEGGDTVTISPIYVPTNISSWYMEGIYGKSDAHVVLTLPVGKTLGGSSLRNLDIDDSQYFDVVNMNIDGQYNGRMGIHCGYVRDCKFFNINIKNVGIGIQIKVNPDTLSTPASYFPNGILKNIELNTITVDSSDTEGFYIGHTNSTTGQSPTKPPDPIWGLKIINCTARNAGWDGFQLTNAMNVYINGITVINGGYKHESAQSQGITLQDYTSGHFFNLTSTTSGAAGITILGVNTILGKNWTITDPTLDPHSLGVFIDNRGIRYPHAGGRKLLVQDLKILTPNSFGTLAISQGTNACATCAATIPGKMVRVTYDQAKWSGGTDGIGDAVNQYIGGNRPSAIADGMNRTDTVYYTNMTRDFLVRSVQTELTAEPLSPIFLRSVSSSEKMTLKWDTMSTGGMALIRYNIYKGKDSTNMPIVATASGLATSWDDTSVPDGDSNYYAVSAVNSNGESDPLYTIKQFKHVVPPPPTVPAAPVLNSAAAGDNKVDLLWTSGASGGSPITNYKVWRGVSSGATNTLVGNTAGTTFTDNSPNNGTLYYYTIAADNSVGTSSKSNELSATPHPPTAPLAPTLNTATAGNGFVTVSWTPGNDGGSPITNYKVYRGTVSGTTTTFVANTTNTTYTDNTVTNETRYYYAIVPENAIGAGTKSNELTAFPSAMSVPGAPTSVSATPGTGQITISWSAPVSDGGSAITGYKIMRGTSAGGAKNPIATVSASTFTRIDGGRAAGTTYYYTVIATNNVGDGPASSEVSAAAN